MKIQNITDIEIEEAKRVMQKHVVAELNCKTGLEALYFCIASQATPWEKASRFVDSLRASCPENKDYFAHLTDKEVLKRESKNNQKKIRLRFHHQERFAPSADYFLASVNPQEIVNEVFLANYQTREKYVEQLNFVDYKTFSFWHLCLGGKNLATIDVHVRRRLATDFKFDIPEKYYTVERRPGKIKLISSHAGLFEEECPIIKIKKQQVTPQPNKTEYTKLENQMRDYFSQDPRFLYEGKTDMALVTTLLWWRGARRTDPNQTLLQGYNDQHSDPLPYGNK